MHFWNDDTIHNIGNTLGFYIDNTEPWDGMHTCVRICVELDIDKGIPKATQLTLDN